MFSLTGEEEAECIEEVEVFKYLRRMMDRSYNDWPKVLRNIRKERQVWGRIRKMLRREGADPDVLDKFYCAIILVVLLFGAETWVMSEPMAQRLEGAHVGFL